LNRVLRGQLGQTAFQIVHLSIQHNHLHLLVEAVSKQALSDGMRVFASRAAKAINRVQHHEGKVFLFRYHATQIRTPRQARHALAYVLNNWRHHGEDAMCEASRRAKLDPYASGYSFDGWKDGWHEAAFESLAVAAPRSWLLRVGWKKYGSIDPFERPGGH
jgi:REP element-mobilizing transposase RayT